jgi:uncharacterized protein YllA (UPF0747 family)
MNILKRLKYSLRNVTIVLARYAEQQEQYEAQALHAAMLAYKHGLASSSDTALLLEAILAEGQV